MAESVYSYGFNSGSMAESVYSYGFLSGTMAESVVEEPAHSRVIRRNLTELCERISIIGLYEKLLEKGALSRIEVNRIKVGTV